MKPTAKKQLEVARLAALETYEVLDTKNERAFDDLTSLIAGVCQTPIALVSLLDTDRQWFKSRYGIDALETPREYAFCDHAIRDPGVMVVNDAQDDDRFCNNPLVVDAPNIRFYAGSPLIDGDGHALGTLCVIDREPRQLTPEQIAALEKLSRQVVHLLELRRSQRQLAGCLKRIRDIADMIPICSHCNAVRDESDEWQRIETYFHEIDGLKFTHGVCPTCMVKHYAIDLVDPRD